MKKSVLISLCGSAVCGSFASCNNENTQKPNIIIILTDDMGYECVGAYGGTYNTPNIDRLAEQGIKFDYAYAQPLSTPSRVKIMTGMYNHKNYSSFGFMNQDQKTFGHLAQMAGYVTTIVGKWQLGPNPNLPAHFGFDSYNLWQLNYPRTRNSERYANAFLEENEEVLERTIDTYGPDRQADYIDRFIETNRDRPFFIYYPMTLPHDPFVPTPISDSWATNPEDRQTEDVKYFADMVEHCDLLIGRLVDKLKKEGVFDNTLIIFTSDNGTNIQIVSKMKDGSYIRGGKGTTTDAGTRVPFIISYGNRQGKPHVSNDLIDFTDVLPTVAQAMGIEVPEEWDIDGVSFLPQVMGETGSPRKWVFCHYDSFRQGHDRPAPNARRYIRNHRYKLYSTGEFYDIKEDVLEENDIQSGNGSAEAENARQFLASELGKFPKWEVGDIPVRRVELPGLETSFRNWRDTGR